MIILKHRRNDKFSDALNVIEVKLGHGQVEGHVAGNGDQFGGIGEWGLAAGGAHDFDLGFVGVL